MSAVHAAAIGVILLGSAVAVQAQTTTTTTTTIERQQTAPLTLRPEQRRTIVQSVTRERVAPAEEIEVRVGRRVPSTVVLSEFPREIYVEEPELERLRYFQIHGRVVLVDPVTSEVVDVLED